MSRPGLFKALLTTTLVTPALAGLWLLAQSDDDAPPTRARAARATAARSLSAPVTLQAPAPAPQAAPEAQAAAPGAAAGAAAQAAAAASRTWAALPPVEPEVPDEVELESRRRLTGQLVEWLAIEDHPAAAIIEAEQLAELAPWLTPGDEARLLAMARTDDLALRRRAAFIVLGGQRPATAERVSALLEAFVADPDEEARAGLVQALLSLRQAGGVVDAALAEALDPRHGPLSPEVQALRANGAQAPPPR